ncbi:hypothetical protein [Bradyrhizobium sp. NC92]|uniref:hypothetical protein n=1 Tax=Bradyrhizobium sp. (strain NC92) TaxID=55395 RepID=UPI0021AA8DB6|nr:hypothetical protein [Bradyrhizobium sp. NC92]UWU68200.1 hypothetical protein N2602_34735 [Bradyrhizobium sp. NC92]
MIFYAKPFGLREEDTDYKFVLARFVVGLLLVGGLIGASFLAKSMQWQSGADTLLDLGKIAFGGLVGLLFGEKNAVKEIRRRPRIAKP